MEEVTNLEEVSTIDPLSAESNVPVESEIVNSGEESVSSNPITNSNEDTNENKENDVQINDDDKGGKKTGDIAVKSCQLALSRIKTIMKTDPDLGLTSKESVFLIAKATELFIEFLSKESYKFTNQGSRKTLQRKDIDQAVNTVDSLCFLDAALD